MDVDEQVAALTQEVQQEQPNRPPLDGTYASIDRIEDYYRARLEQGVASAELDSRVAAYLGTILARATGGKWQPPRTAADTGRASIVSLPHLKGAKFYPIDAVLTFKRTRLPGYLADATARYDVVKRRGDLQQLLADREKIGTAFATEVKALVGEHAVLDGTPESLAYVEEAFRKLVAAMPPRELRRRMLNGAILYLGDVVQRAVHVDWTVSEEPRHADLGQARLNGWAPISAILNIGPDTSPGILRNVHDMLVEAGSRR